MLIAAARGWIQINARGMASAVDFVAVTLSLEHYLWGCKDAMLQRFIIFVNHLFFNVATLSTSIMLATLLTCRRRGIGPADVQSAMDVNGFGYFDEGESIDAEVEMIRTLVHHLERWIKRTFQGEEHVVDIVYSGGWCCKTLVYDEF